MNLAGNKTLLNPKMSLLGQTGEHLSKDENFILLFSPNSILCKPEQLWYTIGSLSESVGDFWNVLPHSCCSPTDSFLCKENSAKSKDNLYNVRYLWTLTRCALVLTNPKSKLRFRTETKGHIFIHKFEWTNTQLWTVSRLSCARACVKAHGRWEKSWPR